MHRGLLGRQALARLLLADELLLVVPFGGVRIDELPDVRVLGRVETMSQQSTQKDGVGYDSAAVMLEAPAKQVYATALNALRRAQAQGISITREDDTALMVQFTNGQQIAGIKISQLGDKLSHMLITSAHTGSQPNAAALVSDSVLRVCREMNVECSPARQ